MVQPRESQGGESSGLSALNLDALAYEQASRALEQQAGVLNELRQRTSTLIAVTALVATFLGGRTLDAPTRDQGPRLVLAGALLALLIGLLACLVVLVPTRMRRRKQQDGSGDTTGSTPRADEVLALCFTMNVEVILDRAEERDMEVPDTPLMDTARTLQLAWNENSPIIAVKQKAFGVGALALALQAGGWIAFIALGREVI